MKCYRIFIFLLSIEILNVIAKKNRKQLHEKPKVDCVDITVHNNSILKASCKSEKGLYTRTWINLNDCIGKTSKGLDWVLSGKYSYNVTECKLDEHFNLVCHTKSKEEDKLSIDLFTQIENKNGILFCKNNPASQRSLLTKKSKNRKDNTINTRLHINCSNFKFKRSFVKATCQSNKEEIRTWVDLDDCIGRSQSGLEWIPHGNFSLHVGKCKLDAQGFLVCEKKENSSAILRIELFSEQGLTNNNGMLVCRNNPASQRSELLNKQRQYEQNQNELPINCSNFTFKRSFLKATCQSNLGEKRTWVDLNDCIGKGQSGLEWIPHGKFSLHVGKCQLDAQSMLVCEKEENSSTTFRIELFSRQGLTNNNGMLVCRNNPASQRPELLHKQSENGKNPAFEEKKEPQHLAPADLPVSPGTAIGNKILEIMKGLEIKSSTDPKITKAQLHQPELKKDELPNLKLAISGVIVKSLVSTLASGSSPVSEVNKLTSSITKAPMNLEVKGKILRGQIENHNKTK